MNTKTLLYIDRLIINQYISYYVVATYFLNIYEAPYTHVLK